jgi:hypothetical protein
VVEGGIGKCGDAVHPGIYIRLEDPDVLNFIKKAAKIPESSQELNSEYP